MVKSHSKILYSNVNGQSAMHNNSEGILVKYHQTEWVYTV